MKNMLNLLKFKRIYFILCIIILITIVSFFSQKTYGYENNTIPDISTMNRIDLDLPEKYDLRNDNGINYLTPVKNQENYGLCWAFSSTTAFESALKKSGYVDKSFNEWYSPYQIDAAITKNKNNGNISYIGKYDVIREPHKFGDGEPITSAFRAFTTAYSPVLENVFSKEKYNFYYENSSLKFDVYEIFNEKNNEYYVTDFDLLTNVNDISQNEVIKYYIMNYGAVPFATYAEFDSCDFSATECYLKKIEYTSDYETESGHAMTLIGWDDTKQSWIVQNSYGPNLAILYLPYDSYMVQQYGIKNISKIDFDNRYYGIDGIYPDAYSAIYKYNKVIENKEIVDSILLDVPKDSVLDIYLSRTGNEEDFEKISTITSKFEGRKSIDLLEKNILLENDTFSFKIEDKTNKIEYPFFGTSLYVFTKDKNEFTKKGIYLYDIYDITDSSQNLIVKLKTKNIEDKSDVSFVIKNDLQNDVTSNFKLIDSYLINDLAQYKFQLDFSPSNTIKEYSVDIILDNKVVATKKFNISNKLNPFSKGTGTIEDPFIITSPEQLDVFIEYPEFLNYAYELGCDLDLTNYDFIPIGGYHNKFKGVFDGNNYSIIGLNKFISNSTYDKGFGFFGSIENSTIKNLKIEQFNLDSGVGTNYYSGLLVGNAENSVIQDIYVKNSSLTVSSPGVNYSLKVGTVVGYAKNSSLNDIYSSADLIINDVSDKGMFLYNSYGGIIGEINSDRFKTSSGNSIEYSGTIKINNTLDSNPIIGGIVGKIANNATFSNIRFASDILINKDTYSNIGYIAGEKQLLKMFKVMVWEKDSNIPLFGSKSLVNDNEYSNIYVITDNYKENTDTIKYINRNDSSFLKESEYNFDWEYVWYMDSDGPRLKKSQNPITKKDIFGESDIYNIDLEKGIITNVKPNKSGLTVSDFINNFKYFSGEIYNEDGVTKVSNDDVIKTGMIIKKGKIDWRIIVSGDLDGNGTINSGDTILLRRHIAGGYATLKDYQQYATDVNNDGNTNAGDVILIRRGIAGGYDGYCIWGDGCK